MDGSKPALRRRLLAGRAALAAEEIERRARALSDVATGLASVSSAGSLAAYVSVGTEPGTRPLLEELAGSGVRVLLPVMLPDRSLDWAPYDGSKSLRLGRHGLLEPVGSRLGAAALGSVDVVIVPALAVDRAGHRLGRGGGFYDRALGHVPPGIPVFAAVYAEEVLDRVPVEHHDRPVGGALTPAGAMRVG